MALRSAAVTLYTAGRQTAAVGVVGGRKDRRIHDRMPMAVTPDHWNRWLDPRLDDAETLQGLMAPPTGLEVYAISKAVNDVKNNSPELLQPVPAEPVADGGE